MMISRAFCCREFDRLCHSWKCQEESRSVETAELRDQIGPIGREWSQRWIGGELNFFSVCSVHREIQENLKTAQTERPRRMSKIVEGVFVPRLLVSLCGSRLVAGAILNDVGTAKKQLTHAYVVPLMCHGMLRRDVKVAHTTLQW
jgi:hypothetical protein